MTQYTVGNVKRCIDLMNYVKTMMLHARGAGIPKNTYQLALAVYHRIDSPLRQGIQCPCKETMVKDTFARICKL